MNEFIGFGVLGVLLILVFCWAFRNLKGEPNPMHTQDAHCKGYEKENHTEREKPFTLIVSQANGKKLSYSGNCPPTNVSKIGKDDGSDKKSNGDRWIYIEIHAHNCILTVLKSKVNTTIYSSNISQ